MTVWTPSNRAVGGLTALGGICTVVATIPTRWYGPRPTDSYVFDPPRFSALWIERTVVPVVAVGAALLMLVGLLALFRRDRERMARWQRWFAVVALVGAAVGTLATVLLVSTGGRATADPTAALNALLGAALALFGTVIVLPGSLAWGIGYLRAGRRRPDRGRERRHRRRVRCPARRPAGRTDGSGRRLRPVDARVHRPIVINLSPNDYLLPGSSLAYGPRQTDRRSHKRAHVLGRLGSHGVVRCHPLAPRLMISTSCQCRHWSRSRHLSVAVLAP